MPLSSLYLGEVLGSWGYVCVLVGEKLGGEDVAFVHALYWCLFLFSTVLLLFLLLVMCWQFFTRICRLIYFCTDGCFIDFLISGL